MRIIKYIVVHCTATQPEATIEAIKNYWKETLGWKNPGYHYLIKRDGEIVKLQNEKEIANGVKGHNKESIHISYIGGVDKEGKPEDNRTRRQKAAMFDLLVSLSVKYPHVEILGHRDFQGVVKACPSFDVKSWLGHHEPDIDLQIAA